MVKQWNPLGCSPIEHAPSHYGFCVRSLARTPERRRQQIFKAHSSRSPLSYSLFLVKALLCLGLDANTRMSGFSDGCMIGDAVPDDPDDDSERPRHLYELLHTHRLWLLNTWLPGDDPQLWKTRLPSDSIRELRFGEGGKQIDFIALSKLQSVDDVKIARDLMFSSDHFPLTISYSSQNRRSQTSQHRQQDRRHSKTRLPPVRNWQPNDNLVRCHQDNPRYPGRTGRQSPDFMRWLMSTQNLV